MFKRFEKRELASMTDEDLMDCAVEQKRLRVGPIGPFHVALIAATILGIALAGFIGGAVIGIITATTSLAAFCGLSLFSGEISKINLESAGNILQSRGLEIGQSLREPPWLTFRNDGCAPDETPDTLPQAGTLTEKFSPALQNDVPYAGPLNFKKARYQNVI